MDDLNFLQRQLCFRGCRSRHTFEKHCVAFYGEVTGSGALGEVARSQWIAEVGGDCHGELAFEFAVQSYAILPAREVPVWPMECNLPDGSLASQYSFFDHCRLELQLIRVDEKPGSVQFLQICVADLCRQRVAVPLRKVAFLERKESSRD